jgi:hypothetical protein
MSYGEIEGNKPHILIQQTINKDNHRNLRTEDIDGASPKVSMMMENVSTTVTALTSRSRPSEMASMSLMGIRTKPIKGFSSRENLSNRRKQQLRGMILNTRDQLRAEIIRQNMDQRTTMKLHN